MGIVFEAGYSAIYLHLLNSCCIFCLPLTHLDKKLKKVVKAVRKSVGDCIINELVSNLVEEENVIDSIAEQLVSKVILTQIWELVNLAVQDLLGTGEYMIDDKGELFKYQPQVEPYEDEPLVVPPPDKVAPQSDHSELESNSDINIEDSEDDWDKLKEGRKELKRKAESSSNSDELISEHEKREKPKPKKVQKKRVEKRTSSASSNEGFDLSELQPK